MCAVVHLVGQVVVLVEIGIFVVVLVLVLVLEDLVAALALGDEAHLEVLGAQDREAVEGRLRRCRMFVVQEGDVGVVVLDALRDPSGDRRDVGVGVGVARDEAFTLWSSLERVLS